MLLDALTLESGLGFQFLGIPPKGELADSFYFELDGGIISFQFLGIPPKGERNYRELNYAICERFCEFPISRDPPEGGTISRFSTSTSALLGFPISRDPPEGGTCFEGTTKPTVTNLFPISRDPPEGGTE